MTAVTSAVSCAGWARSAVAVAVLVMTWPSMTAVSDGRRIPMAMACDDPAGRPNWPPPRGTMNVTCNWRVTGSQMTVL